MTSKKKYHVKIRVDALLEVQGVVAASMEDAALVVRELCLMSFAKPYRGMSLETLGVNQHVVGVDRADAWEGL